MNFSVRASYIAFVVSDKPCLSAPIATDTFLISRHIVNLRISFENHVPADDIFVYLIFRWDAATAWRHGTSLSYDMPYLEETDWLYSG